MIRLAYSIENNCKENFVQSYFGAEDWMRFSFWFPIMIIYSERLSCSVTPIKCYWFDWKQVFNTKMKQKKNNNKKNPFNWLKPSPLWIWTKQQRINKTDDYSHPIWQKGNHISETRSIKCGSTMEFLLFMPPCTHVPFPGNNTIHAFKYAFWTID